jgi:organic hydroperoxide reductase OsmC/OhrA
MSIEHNYAIKLDMIEDRLGEIKLTDPKKPSLRVATPPEFPGGKAGILSPEDLFVASVASCKMTTFCAMAERLKVQIEKLSIDATGKITKASEGYLHFSKMTIKLLVIISDKNNLKKAEKCVDLTNRYCLITRSLKTPVELIADIKVQDK